MMYREDMGYSERLTDPGNPTTGIYTATSAPVVASIYTIASTEKSHDDILNRLEKTDNFVLMRFPHHTLPDSPNRVVMQLHFAQSSPDAAEGNDPLYGIRTGNFAGKPCLFVDKICDSQAVLDSAIGSVGGSSIGGAKQSGQQLPEQSRTVTTTGVLEAMTGGAVEPKAWTDGRTSGLALADIGPYVALLRTPWVGAGATGVSPLHGKWR